MQLIQAELHGFRRFENASINLHGDLLAIVGPNEAGKTSLFDALASVENTRAFDQSDFTRGMLSKPRGSDAVVRLCYLLEDKDLDLFQKHALTGEPRFMIFEKSANGGTRVTVEPRPELDLTPRKELRDRLQRTINNTRIRSFLRAKYPPFDGSNTQLAEKDLIDVLRSFVGSIDTSTTQLGQQVKPQVSRLLKVVESARSGAGARETRALKRLSEALNRFREVELGGHPRDQFYEALEEMRPELQLFGSQERSLKSEYPVSDLPNPPPALRNLFELGELRPIKLHRAYEQGIGGRREKLEENTNKVLKERFLETWSQSNVYPRFDFGDEAIRLYVPTRDTYSPIAERSDGLRSFVALCAFSALKSGGRPLVILIDEAEQHLHYDAQADLVQVFEEQEVVSKIIYTTHSAGCLPNDLGTRVRVVRPRIGDNDADTGRSQIRNSFWESGAGFSELMLAMGASLLALVPSRRAVIAEGASETILLPRLLREATGDEGLGFQVAPGLANVPNDQLEDLELEASRVAYLVDGDQAGDDHKTRLKKAGIDETRILQLPSQLVLEDFIDGDSYAAVVNQILYAYQAAGSHIAAGDVGGPNRTRQLRRWCNSQGFDVPSKVSIARHLAACPTEELILDATKSTQMKQLAKQIKRALKR